MLQRWDSTGYMTPWKSSALLRQNLGTTLSDRSFDSEAEQDLSAAENWAALKDAVADHFADVSVSNP
jgi:hypothetical protein